MHSPVAKTADWISEYILPITCADSLININLA